MSESSFILRDLLAQADSKELARARSKPGSARQHHSGYSASSGDSSIVRSSMCLFTFQISASSTLSTCATRQCKIELAVLVSNVRCADHRCQLEAPWNESHSAAGPLSVPGASDPPLPAPYMGGHPRSNFRIKSKKLER